MLFIEATDNRYIKRTTLVSHAHCKPSKKNYQLEANIPFPAEGDEGKGGKGGKQGLRTSQSFPKSPQPTTDDHTTQELLLSVHNVLEFSSNFNL